MKKNVHEFEIKLEKEWETALDKAFKKKSKEVKIDGFRKGAVPKDLYIKKFGIESLYMDAVDLAINDAYKKILEDNKDLVPAVEPKVDVKAIDAKSITFAFTVIGAPEVTLGDYKNLGIKLEKAKVTAKEVDEEVKKLQDQMADLVVKDGKVEEGNTAVIDFTGYVDGEKLEGGNAENFSLEIGSHSFIPGFEEGLVGHKAGENVTLNLKFPEEYVENLKGKDVKFDVTINEVKERVLPEVNEDFFKDLGYENIKTLDELKEEIKKNMLEQKDHELEDAHLDKCLDKACENMKVDINEEIIDDEVHRMIHQYEDQLKAQGLSLEKYYELTGTTHEDLHKNMEGEATKRIKYRYLIEKVAEVEKVDFTDKEVKAEAKKLAENYGITEDELVKAYGSLEVVKYDMKMHRALEIIKDSNK